MLPMRPSDAEPPAAAAPSFLPALKHLALAVCKVQHKSFLQLSQLTGLTSLCMHHLTLCTASWAPLKADQHACRTSKAFATVLQQLQGLKALMLLKGAILQDPAAALAPLSTMQHLQHVSLWTDACNTAALAHLPTSLTSLELRGYKEDVWPSGNNMSFLRVTTSSLPQLPLLCCAKLEWVRLEPGVLACWSGLTELSIGTVRLQAPGAAGEAVSDLWELWDNQLEQQAQRILYYEIAKLSQMQVSGIGVEESCFL
jgi:hypothetical protein